METEEEVVVDAQAEEKDWKAEAERLAGQVNNLNKALHETRSKKPVDIDSMLEEKLQAIEKRRMQDDIDEIASSLTSDEAERAKIMDVYTNRLKPSGFSRGSIEKDLKEAALLANKDKVLSEAEKKARRSMAEKSSLERSSVNVTSAPTDDDEPELTASERAMLEQIKPYTK